MSSSTHFNEGTSFTSLLSLPQPPAANVFFSGDQGQHLCKYSKNSIFLPKAWEQIGLCGQVTYWKFTRMSHGLKEELLYL